MHGLDAPMAAGATEKLLGIRESLQRVRIVTGRGEILHDKSADPGIRPAALQRLRIGAEAVNWQVLEKAGSITLRPMGIAPTNAQRASRFAIFVVPMCTVMGFTFRDLAGSTMDDQGLAFGIIAGILLTNGSSIELQRPFWMITVSNLELLRNRPQQLSYIVGTPYVAA